MMIGKVGLFGKPRNGSYVLLDYPQRLHGIGMFDNHYEVGAVNCKHITG